jgi:uncharacterized phiE125 gp8 family phage protein
MALRVLESEAVMTADLPVAVLAARLRLPDGWDAVPGALDRLQASLFAAMSTTEARLGQVLLRRVLVIGGRFDSAGRFSLPIAPVIDLCSLQVDRGAGLETVDDARLIDGDVIAAGSLGAEAEVRITVLAGYGAWGDVPAGLREVVLLEAERGETGDAVLSPLIDELAAPFRRLRMGARP